MAIDGLSEELGTLRETDDPREISMSVPTAQRSINTVSGVQAEPSVENPSGVGAGGDEQKAASLPTVPGWLKGTAQVVIGAAALLYILSKSDSHELLEALKATRLWYM